MKVQVKIMKDDDEGTFVQVEVFSAVKQGLLAFKKISLPNDQLEYRVQIAAGACAEQLCNRYADTLDPAVCAKLAAEALAELKDENPKYFLTS